MPKAEIIQLREKIDSIDKAILKLLSERVDCAVKIGALKDELRASSDSDKIGAYDPVRENQIIQALNNFGIQLPFNGTERIFRQIISLCRNAAHKSTVCMFGSISESECTEVFGQFSDYTCFNNEKEWLEALKNNPFNIGVTDVESEKMEKVLSATGYVCLGQIYDKMRIYAHR